ncbi:MAG: 23S rRNA (guanosine(2251)-2'-O)-methyltransferase RlmB [Coriobacteriia bacterium]|nr:23S rRNA (guanosine(2251)-2'-O)-methyltransferase RlmB [Coriobacteriia bacterium]
MRIEGRNAVLEALRSGLKVQRAMLLRGIKPGKNTDEILAHLQQQQIKPQYVARADLDKRSEHGAHQGVMIWTAPFEFSPLNQVVQNVEGQSNALVIVLDHVTDPGNLGAIARSAEVFGAAGLIVAKDRAAAVTPAAHKAAAGALSHLPVVQVTNISRTLQQLKDADFWIAGASEHAKTAVWDTQLNGRIALVMGAEDKGLSRLVKDNCDFLVKLPQLGKVQSLNVAQAATALMYEFSRQCEDGA